jgi:hypothetical protein
MISCVMDRTQLHVLYAGGEGAVDTLGSGVMVWIGVTLGGVCTTLGWAAMESPSLVLESLP